MREKRHRDRAIGIGNPRGGKRVIGIGREKGHRDRAIGIGYFRGGKRVIGIGQ